MYQWFYRNKMHNMTDVLIKDNWIRHNAYKYQFFYIRDK